MLKNMNNLRKQVNWQAICNGRDLLDEIENLKKDYEKEFRKKIANEILNPKDIIKQPLTAGDTLDW